MTFDGKRLYELLPALYRIRDAEQGGALGQLLSVIAEQIAVLEEDLAQLYDDQFIETCAEWAVPYIGDLIGYHALHGVVPKVSSPRAEVANTIAYRRRKGTAAMLEQLARDVTGWDASVVEFFELLATTQHMNHIRLGNLSVPSITQWEPLERLNTPFDSMAHTGDVRRIARRRGRYNIPNIGIFVWRCKAYRLTHSPAFKIDDRRFLFNPLGIDTQLFTRPETEEEISHIAEPTNVPMPISRHVLKEYFERYYGKDKSLSIEGADSDKIIVCNLSDKDVSGNWGYLPPPPGKIAIDPVLGRIAFADNQEGLPVVNFHYGFSADMGGGEYPRSSLGTATAHITPGGQTLAQAIATAGQEDVIQIDFNTAIGGDVAVDLINGQRLTIQAKDTTRPLIIGAININSAKDAEVTIDGLLIAGHIEVSGTEEMMITLRHCTVTPWLEREGGKSKKPVSPSVKWQESGGGSKLYIEKTITGRLITSNGITTEISDSIVDGLEENSVALAGYDDGKSPAGKITVVRSSIVGSVFVEEVELIENSIFTGIVTSERLQKGCVRFSYLPRDSKVPRRYYCQPDLAIKKAIDAAKKQEDEFSSNDAEKIAQQIADQSKPLFTVRVYGEPAYMQLYQSCMLAIQRGADDGSEMGAFHDLYQAQRETNLRVRLDEYLRFGLEAGMFYAS